MSRADVGVVLLWVCWMYFLVDDVSEGYVLHAGLPGPT